MNEESNCNSGDVMPDIWAYIVIAILLMVVYGYVSSKISERRNRKLRESTIPEIENSLKADISYNVHLSDGRKFLDVTLLGAIEGEDPGFSFAGWDGMLVLMQSSGKQIYLKKTSIRFIEEA